MYFWLHFHERDFETLLNWKPGVHKGEGISLPRDVEYTLSLNLKYLFPQPMRTNVAWTWFNAIERKAKNTYIFRNKSRTTQEGLPDVPFVKNAAWEPVVNKHWFRQGITAGRKELQLQLSKPMPPRLIGQRDVFDTITLTPQALTGWLTDNECLCFISDKNLGIVVVTQDWYWEQVKKFIDLPVFESFVGDWASFLRHVRRQISVLTHDVSEINFWITPKVLKFIDQYQHRNDIPKFHGIPKIHKNPWKIRPIVPMHSYVTSTIAIVLHNLLLPVQRACPWICESSRELCAEVEDFNVLGNSVRIHTGDVTAMYTSIPWHAFRVALAAMVHNFPEYNDNDALETWILDAAKLLWESTVFQLGNRLWHQKDGIPMGIHCGPVFANLYLAFYEKHYLEGFDGLYRRYIDDIFVLHSNDDVVSKLIQAPGMDIVWAHSDVGLSFLDVWFHTHEGSSDVCFRPYQKAKNHHQYLPWRSSHPLSVKRGMVKGELIRIANISYRESYFVSWRTTFQSRLIARGWPKKAVMKWSKQVKFDRRHAPVGAARARTGEYLIAVSSYNPVWEKVSSADIWSKMLTTWRESAPADKPMPFPQYTMIAKKRTKSLWDLVRSVNQSLLRTEYEETTLEEVLPDLSTMDLDEDLPVSAPMPLGGLGR